MAWRDWSARRSCRSRVRPDRGRNPYCRAALDRADAGRNCRGPWSFALDAGVRIIHIDEFFALGVDNVNAEARRIVGDGPVYVSFDVDAIDPAFAPGTGTPEIGGFSTADAQRMIRALDGLDLVGADVVEVSPPFDPSGMTALVGATLMFEIVCVLAAAVSRGTRWHPRDRAAPKPVFRASWPTAD